MTAKDKRRHRSSKPGWQQEIAEERISILFGLAKHEFGGHPERSDRYVELARKIGMRYNVRLRKEFRMSLCRSCRRYLVPGKNCVVRSNARTLSVEVKCLGCGRVMRFPYGGEKRGKNITERGQI
jgi:ribonuclease P protein subunit RPR2